ncbi:hypothetical protein NHX12_014192 [Muraenolepis orangiensis]|uniref:Uncharacterized protein n=1 Tax=Muraenolepis orangiensis TaxID=630683 RepID=A0A9Q0DBH9_9TELE|nr:hypothetical protein NHX12_014192 [Muraenolepis orangiensis]
MAYGIVRAKKKEKKQPPSAVTAQEDDDVAKGSCSLCKRPIKDYLKMSYDTIKVGVFCEPNRLACFAWRASVLLLWGDLIRHKKSCHGDPEEVTTATNGHWADQLQIEP